MMELISSLMIPIMALSAMLVRSDLLLIAWNWNGRGHRPSPTFAYQSHVTIHHRHSLGGTMAGNDAQVQFQQNGGTRKWRYQGVAFDGHHQAEGHRRSADPRPGHRTHKKTWPVSDRLDRYDRRHRSQRRDQHQSARKIPQQKRLRGDGPPARHHGRGGCVTDPRAEHRHRTNREPETAQGAPSLRGAGGGRFIVLRGHGRRPGQPVPTHHGQYDPRRRNRAASWTNPCSPWPTASKPT